MKKLTLILAASIAMTSCATMQKMSQTMDVTQVVNAGVDVVTALTITDEQVIMLTQAAVVSMDATGNIAPATSDYSKRLARLTRSMTSVDGTVFNFKVYQTNEINAFACADGSVRVYSGLMNAMTDEEIVAIIGHEIGHVKNHDTRDAMKNAYYTSAARKAIGSFNQTTLGQLTNSELGDLAQSYLDAQYSQKQELDADEYGFTFSIKHGYSPYAMANALQKLVTASGGAQSSAVAQMFSSHPDSSARAARMKTKAAAYKK